jgi:hypothetical protein
MISSERAERETKIAEYNNTDLITGPVALQNSLPLVLMLPACLA